MIDPHVLHPVQDNGRDQARIAPARIVVRAEAHSQTATSGKLQAPPPGVPRVPTYRFDTTVPSWYIGLPVLALFLAALMPLSVREHSLRRYKVGTIGFLPVVIAIFWNPFALIGAYTTAIVALLAIVIALPIRLTWMIYNNLNRPDRHPQPDPESTDG